MRKLKLLPLYLIVAVLWNGVAHSFCGLDFSEIHTLKGGRKVEELAEAKIGTFNVLNLEYSPGKYLDDPKTGKRVFKKGNLTKDALETAGIAKAIKDEDLDMVILQEVEGREALERFSNAYLGDAYEALILKGNDGRGIEIGFLVKKDLPFKIRMQGHAGRTFINPGTKKSTPVFSRDLPALHIRLNTTSMNDPPDMILVGTHYKSQRDRKGDPRSVKLRTRQVEETKAILEEYEKAYPGVPILLGGDFNADIHTGAEFKSLFAGGFMRDAFDLGKKVSNPKERITHTFHPRGGETKNNQLDAILVNKAAADSVIEAKVYRYKDSSGREKPIPKTYEERKKNPSDHFMVVVKARLAKFFQK